MIISRPTKPSPLLDHTPKKGGCHGLPYVLGSAPRKVYAEDVHWPIEGFHAEKAQASVNGRSRCAVVGSNRTLIPRMVEGHHYGIRNCTYHIRNYFTGEMERIKMCNMMVLSLLQLSATLIN